MTLNIQLINEAILLAAMISWLLVFIIFTVSLKDKVSLSQIIFSEGSFTFRELDKWVQPNKIKLLQSFTYIACGLLVIGSLLLPARFLLG